MSDDIFLITIGGIITIEIIIVAYLKYCILRKSANSSTQAKGIAASRLGSYRGVERRAKKRSAGALYQRNDGNWAFR